MRRPPRPSLPPPSDTDFWNSGPDLIPKKAKAALGAGCLAMIAFYLLLTAAGLWGLWELIQWIRRH